MQRAKILVSVIIPFKDSTYLKYLRQAIDSVLRQKMSTEIIVVADNVIGKLPNLGKKVSVLHNRSGSKGPGLPRNIGLNKARGEYIAFLDADDYWEEDFLDNSVKILEKKVDAIGVISFSRKTFEEGISIVERAKLMMFNLPKDLVLLYCSTFNNSTLRPDFMYLCQISHVLFKRDKIFDLSFNLSYKYCEDWKFVLDALKRGEIMINLKRLVNFRYWPKSNTFVQIKKIPDKIKYYEKIHAEMIKRFGNKVGVILFNWYFKFFLIRNG